MTDCVCTDIRHISIHLQWSVCPLNSPTSPPLPPRCLYINTQLAHTFRSQTLRSAFHVCPSVFSWTCTAILTSLFHLHLDSNRHLAAQFTCKVVMLSTLHRICNATGKCDLAETTVTVMQPCQHSRCVEFFCSLYTG